MWGQPAGNKHIADDKRHSQSSTKVVQFSHNSIAKQLIPVRPYRTSTTQKSRYKSAINSTLGIELSCMSARPRTRPFTSTLQPSTRLAQLNIHFTRTMATAIPKTMKGVLIEKTGGVEVLQYKSDLPVPTPKAGEVLVRNDFIGVNYIDTYLPLVSSSLFTRLPIQCQFL